MDNKLENQTMRNYWIVFIKPFKVKDRGDRSIVLPYQKRCIDENIFGIGWPLETDKISFGENMSEKAREYHYDEYGKRHYPEYPSKKATNCMLKMKPGDIVITRLMNGHYQIGELATCALYLNKTESPYNHLSWGCRVEKWYEVLETELPATLRGRFSQSYLGTVQPVTNKDVISMIISLFENKKYGKSSVPPIILDEANFALNLDYKELEDLVYLHMLDIHKDEGYVLLPSSCKMNQPVYELYFTRDVGDYITCQVKNQTPAPDPSEYADDSHIRKIYIFSGLWNDADANEYMHKAKCLGVENVTAVLPSALFQTLRKYQNLFSNAYRTIDQ